MQVQRVSKVNIKPKHEYYDYLKYLCRVSKNLYNTALFIQRQAYFDSRYYKNYNELDREARLKTSAMYKYYHILPQQVAQQTLKVLDKNWKSFFKSNSEYKKQPNKFTGKPHPPKYLESDSYFNLYITEQSLHYENEKIRVSCLSKLFNEELKISTKLSNIENIIKLNQIRILPRGNHLIVEIVYIKEINDKKLNGKQVIGIDIGIDNLLTIIGDTRATIVNGKGLKSINHYYNKKKSAIQSELKTKQQKEWSKCLQRLTDKRKNKIEDAFHKISRWLINFCKENEISTIVIGQNKDWKRNIRLGKVNNQKFTQIPFKRLEQMIEYKGQEAGINIIFQEESYTSKASYFDNDIIPIYKSKETKYKFSGQRIKRGLYRTKEGKLINADVNGSLNILRKSKVTDDVVRPVSIGRVANPVKINIF